MATNLNKREAQEIYNKLRKAQKLDIAEAVRTAQKGKTPAERLRNRAKAEQMINDQLLKERGTRQLARKSNFSSQLISHYNRVSSKGNPYNYSKATPQQTRFIQERARQGMKVPSITSSYNFEFPGSPRTQSSIRRIARAA